MIKLPKHFNASEYMQLNGDLRYHKNLDPISHFLSNGHLENRKYNKNIGINYPFKLHLIDIKKLNYDYFYDILIDYKLNTITDENINAIIKNQFEINKIENYSIFFNNNQLDISLIIHKLLLDKNNNYINKGIYSERDLAKHINYYTLYNILWEAIKIISDDANKLKKIPISLEFEESFCDKNLAEIFKINDKYMFFYQYFKWHTSHITKNGFKIMNSNNNKKTAVIVETRNHIMLKHIINNVMLNLGNDWNLHIFCGFDNHKFVKETWSNAKITLLPFYNMSVDIYDFVFLNIFFWNSISSEDILIFQTDTFLIDDPIDSFINNYVYLGAPHTNIHGGISYLTPNNFGLNGGFSFRKKSAMLHALNNIKTSDINNYRGLHNMKPLTKTPINSYDIDYEYLFKHFEITKNKNINVLNNDYTVNCADNDFIYETSNSEKQIIENNFNIDLVFEDVFFSHAIEMLKFPKPNNFIAKHFIIQEDVNGLLTNIKGVHGWDKSYIDLSYHKNLLKKYAVKILKKINSNQTLLNYINRENLNIYDFISNNNMSEKLDNTEYILIICHNMGGGTEKYVRDIIELNKNTVIKNKLNKKLCFDIVRILDSNNQCTNILFNEIQLKLVQTTQNIFINKNYNFVHIHYLNDPAFILYNYIMELIALPMPPKIVITLHDYHFIINDKANEYHLTTYNANKQFLDELKNKQSNLYSFKLLKNLLEKVDYVVTGSSTVRVIFNYVFEIKNNLIKVVPHPEPIYFNPIPKNIISYNCLNIGIIGALSISKGAHMAQEMSIYFQTLKLPWKIFHFGAGFTKNLRKQNNIISIGTYTSEVTLREQLIANNINMLWFPAYRHESFCYTLTLGIQTELPILAYDSGTFRERLSFYKNPYKIHECEYDCEQLFNDIKSFYNILKNNSYTMQPSSDFIYDEVKYEKLYL